jgi:hypothetical protein
MLEHVLLVAPKRDVELAIGILTEACDSSFSPATATTLEMADRHIETSTPDLIILDPEVDTPTSVLNFVGHNRERFKRAIWAVLLDPEWWTRNADAILQHEFSSRFRTYYEIHKSPLSEETRARAQAVLRLCYRDFLQRLFIEATGNITIEEKETMSWIQKLKFANKTAGTIVPLFKSDNEKLAYVSMPFSTPYTALYEHAIKPHLVHAEYNLIPIFHGQYPDQSPIPSLAYMKECALFVADLSEQHPNFFVEFGAALRDKVPMILLRNHASQDRSLSIIINPEFISTYRSLEDLQYVLKREIRRRQIEI